MPTLTYVKVAGVPVSFDKETGLLQLAGDKMTVGEWDELKHRVNTLVTGRVELRRNERTPETLPRGSRFIIKNLPELNKMKQGRIKRPPFFLRPFYGRVITKERLNDDDHF